MSKNEKVNWQDYMKEPKSSNDLPKGYNPEENTSDIGCCFFVKKKKKLEPEPVLKQRHPGDGRRLLPEPRTGPWAYLLRYREVERANAGTEIVTRITAWSCGRSAS